jgi:peptidoglycan DL-endopeptidase CwlO
VKCPTLSLRGSCSRAGNVLSRRQRWWLAALAASLAALVATLPALASSPIAAKRAEAQQVYNEIQQLDQNLGRADEQVNLANLRLAHVQYEQKVNRGELAVARLNLARSQKMIAQRLVSLYTTPQPSTLEMILGATSLSGLLTRIDNADRLSSLDGQVIAQVETFKSAVERDARDLASENTQANHLLAERRQEQRSIAGQFAERKRLLASINSEIATLEAQARAEQLRLQQEAQARVRAAQAAQVTAVQDQTVGASAATPEGASVLPASPYGSQVVGIAMSFLGTPYVWGGAAPGGFDCSGLVMYSFEQLGVSLPHSSYAMWDYGIPVPEDQLEPGDLVFFEDLGHVGLYIGGGEYVNAPYTGSVVSVASLDTGWSAANYVGARRIT